MTAFEAQCCVKCRAVSQIVLYLVQTCTCCYRPTARTRPRGLGIGRASTHLHLTYLLMPKTTVHVAPHQSPEGQYGQSPQQCRRVPPHTRLWKNDELCKFWYVQNAKGSGSESMHGPASHLPTPESNINFVKTLSISTATLPCATALDKMGELFLGKLATWDELQRSHMCRASSSTLLHVA